MKHVVDIVGCQAKCSCGICAVMTSPEGADAWGRAHLSEFAPSISSGAMLRGPTSDLITDDQLRAECERRGLFSWADDETRRMLSAAYVDRDEWKAKYKAATSDFYGKRLGEVVEERDKWKRRAEAAEAKLAREEARPSERLSDLPLIDTQDKLTQMLLGARPHERGPGIAATPARDSSIDWLDEDLLCEDV